MCMRSNQPRSKSDPIAATAKELAAHVEKIYQFNETHKLNCKAKDDLEMVSLSLLNIVAELVFIPLATADSVPNEPPVQPPKISGNLSQKKILLPVLAISLMIGMSNRPSLFLLEML
jgi:hypothetical protein